MPIHREKNHPLTVLQDPCLSLEAKGMYCQISLLDSSDPESRKIFNKDFSKKAFLELREKGYCTEEYLVERGFLEVTSVKGAENE